ncbi:MAG: 2-oxo acid dehydrogenase subunit E2 [Chloroflexota bacterium]|nr:2-oxo acid dehydrogenase subunit E2 [Chloroflexota bacterium]
MHEVILPKLGQTMEEGTIVEWLKKEGDPVSEGDVLFEVESDKAVLEVEARADGILRKILVGEGVEIPVLTPVGIIAGPDEDISGAVEGEEEEEAPEEPSAPEAEEEEAAPEAAAEVPAREGRLFASPRARKTAREHDVELRLLEGSGPSGRIIEQDVLDYLERQPAATPLARRVAREKGIALEEISPAGRRIRAEEVAARKARPERVPATAVPSEVPMPPMEGDIEPLSGMRSIIAERMAASAHTTAPITLQSVVDATEFVALRNKLKEALADDLGFSVGYHDLLVAIVARCLKEFPYMNVRLEEEGIRHLEQINVGLAVDTDRGLLVPVIDDADQKSIKEIARESRELIERALEGRSLPDELTGGTFTITNLGMFGIDSFTPIINMPECAILGVGRIRPEPAVVDGEIAIRQRMWLSLTVDHRLVDGAPGARFLQAVARYIESPYLLLS